MSTELPNTTTFENALYARFTKAAVDTQTSLDDINASVLNENVKQRQYEADADTLARMLEMGNLPDVGRQALDAQRTHLYTLKARSVQRVDDLRTQFNKLQVIQEFLRRNVCPHTGTMVHDHFDYHKREDYHRCTVCGVVI